MPSQAASVRQGRHHPILRVSGFALLTSPLFLSILKDPLDGQSLAKLPPWQKPTAVSISLRRHALGWISRREANRSDLPLGCFSRLRSAPVPTEWIDRW